MNTYVYPHIPEAESVAVATGFFDGVHQGHVAVLDKLKQVAARQGIATCVVTYWPHPRTVLGRDEGLMLLSTYEEKQALLAAQGIDYLVCIPFTPQFAGLSYQEFIGQYLVQELHATHLVMGHDQRIGRHAEGDFEQIVPLAARLGIQVHRVDATLEGALAVSSTQVRKALLLGDMQTANHMLGYTYAAQGIVGQGKQLGRTIGYPTANIVIENGWKMLPAQGVYAVQVQLGHHTYGGMLNIGTRPTVDRSSIRTVEVHIFDFDQAIYGQTIQVRFVARLRAEHKFDSLQALRQALDNDKQQALHVLASYHG